MALEIERKYLLKNIPSRGTGPDQILDIKQYYCEDKKNKSNYRLREIFDITNGSKSFVQTFKTKIKDGVYDEHEVSLNKGAFLDLMKFAKTKIIKTRLVYKVEKGLKWEVDVYSEMNLIIAEFEMPSENFKFKIPKYIQEQILLEVTQFDQFTNKSLSSKI